MVGGVVRATRSAASLSVPKREQENRIEEDGFGFKFAPIKPIRKTGSYQATVSGNYKVVAIWLTS